MKLHLNFPAALGGVGAQIVLDVAPLGFPMTTPLAL